MTRTFHISEETYQALTAVAAERGERPEALLQSWLVQVRGQSRSSERAALGGNGSATSPRDLERDPLAPFLDAFEAVAPDGTIWHDNYLADAYADAQATAR